MERRDSQLIIGRFSKNATCRCSDEGFDLILSLKFQDDKEPSKDVKAEVTVASKPTFSSLYGFRAVLCLWMIAFHSYFFMNGMVDTDGTCNLMLKIES